MSLLLNIFRNMQISHANVKSMAGKKKKNVSLAGLKILFGQQVARYIHSFQKVQKIKFKKLINLAL